MPTEKEILEELGVGSSTAISPANVNSVTADQLGNDETVEQLWAMKAIEHAEIYFNLLCSLDPKSLRLTRKDDDLYTSFKSEFPDFRVEKLDEEALKSPSAKEKWRPFCYKYEKQVEDFSFATLLRIDCNDEYSESNSIIVMRLQFFCIEITRNREGYNDNIRKKFKPKPRIKT